MWSGIFQILSPFIFTKILQDNSAILIYKRENWGSKKLNDLLKDKQLGWVRQNHESNPNYCSPTLVFKVHALSISPQYSVIY